VTFSSSRMEQAVAVTTVIHSSPVETVEEYKYLGTILLFVSTNILLTFYYTFTERVLAFSLQDRNRLHNIVKVCSKIIGLPACQLSTVYKQQASGLACSILGDSTHALFPAFEQSSGLRFRCPACKTQRRRATFVPNSILLLNSKGRNNLRCAILQ